MVKINQSTQKKWGESVAKGGFTILPNHLIAYNQFTDEASQISPSEFVILCQILFHWWGESQMPFPSKQTLAVRSGISSRQVQRTLLSLENKGIITRVARYGANNRGRLSNVYDLSALVEKVSRIAKANPSLYDRAPETIKAPAVSGSFDVSE
jgi:hypothetical protein